MLREKQKLAFLFWIYKKDPGLFHIRAFPFENPEPFLRCVHSLNLDVDLCLAALKQESGIVLFPLLIPRVQIVCARPCERMTRTIAWEWQEQSLGIADCNFQTHCRDFINCFFDKRRTNFLICTKFAPNSCYKSARLCFLVTEIFH